MMSVAYEYQLAGIYENYISYKSIDPLFDSLPQLPRLYTLMASIMERNITY